MKSRGAKNRLMIVALLAWGLALGNLACTNVDIEAIVPYSNDKLALRGDFCTTEPAEIIYSTRILFLIDCSDSMRWNDPDGLRADAIGEIEELYREAESVSFGIMRFGTDVEVETENFTKDTDEIEAALEPIKDSENPKQYLGGTDYNAVLGEAINFIERDQVLNPQQLDATYITVFVTDGAPQAGDSDPDDTVNRILDQVRTLKGLGTTFHSLMMSAEMMGVPPEFLTILQAMAATGGGEYKELAGPAALANTLGDLLDLTVILRIFDLKAFYVSNMNTVVEENNGTVSVFADSDGDGLADFIEEDLGTSPLHADSDGDLITDLVETRIGYDPLARELHDRQAEASRDRDSDGLNDYEEILLGTRPEHFDTDTDGIPDGLEVRFDTNPLVEDDRGDYDDDFIPNADEIWGHTNPRLDEQGQQSELAYRYSLYQTGRNEGSHCYHFEVEEITLATVQGGYDGRSVPNRIEMAVVDSPDDNPDLMGNQSLGRVEMIYRAPHFREPNALTLFVEPEDFE